MRMFIYMALCISALALVLSGCSKDTLLERVESVEKPGDHYSLSVSSITDIVPPCERVTFPAPLKIFDIDRYIESDNSSSVTYHIFMPSRPVYEITFTKTVSEEPLWEKTPLYEQYSPAERLYTIESLTYMERSGAITIVEKEDGYYLRGVVGEHIRADAIQYITIDMRVHSSEHMRTFDTNTWRLSLTGQRFILSMQEMVDWFYENIESVSCPTGERLIP